MNHPPLSSMLKGCNEARFALGDEPDLDTDPRSVRDYADMVEAAETWLEAVEALRELLKAAIEEAHSYGGDFAEEQRESAVSPDDLFGLHNHNFLSNPR